MGLAGGATRPGRPVSQLVVKKLFCRDMIRR